MIQCSICGNAWDEKDPSGGGRMVHHDCPGRPKFTWEPTLERIAVALEKIADSLTMYSLDGSGLPEPSFKVVEILSRISSTLAEDKTPRRNVALNPKTLRASERAK